MTAIDREREIEAALGVTCESLNRLRASIADDFKADTGGLSRYAAIEDLATRAELSDSLLIALEGAREGLLALALRQRQHAALLGPNGRTMPAPDSSVAEAVELLDLDVSATDCFRAAGSAMDCMAAAAVLICGLPLPPARAEGGWLLTMPSIPRQFSATSRDAFEAIIAEVRVAGDHPAAGWLAWTMETRNAVVHRGPLLGMWLTRPGAGPGTPKLLVRADTPVHLLLRMEPHLRSAPWSSDMHELATSKDLETLFLPEPAQVTLAAVQEGISRVVETVAALLLNMLSEPPRIPPVAAWARPEREPSARVQDASRFAGIDPTYPTPPIDQIRMHGNSAERLVLAETLRASGSAATP
jgi:hypothetical protein